MPTPPRLHQRNRPLLAHPQALTDDDLHTRMAARRAPDPVIRIALGLYIASRNREFSAVDPTLARLLGHQPLPMRDLLAQQIGAAG